MSEPEADLYAEQVAGVGQRVLARIVDGLILFAAGLVFLLAGQIGSQILNIALGAAYEIYLVTRFGQTLGKRALSVQIQRFGDSGVIPTQQQAIMRWVVLSGPSALGGLLAASTGSPIAIWVTFLWDVALLASVLTDPLKRGWHDKFANTVVVDLD
jgi:uncharacterized RDD family membrane protein YckC